VKPPEARRLRVGDEEVAKSSVALKSPEAFIPRGSKIIGHVSSARAKANGDPVIFTGIEFDKVESPGGKQLTIHRLIKAGGANPHSNPDTGVAGSGTFSNDTGSAQGATVPGPVSTVGPLGSSGQSTEPVLDPRGHGRARQPQPAFR